MAAIKKFFQKRKLDVKFKTAGGGHKLTEDTRNVQQRPASSSGPSRMQQSVSDANRAAAAAALARMDKPTPGSSVGTSAATIRSKVKQEMEAEKKSVRQTSALAQDYAAPQEVVLDHAPVLAVSGVYYHCPMAGPAVLAKQDMEGYIEEFLLTQLAEEPEMATALMVHTLNKDAGKVKVCVDTLCKYIDNVLKNPGQEKFTKIRFNNKAFQDRVASLKGTEEFLQAAGFSHCILPSADGTSEEDFLVLKDEYAADTGRLENLKEVLRTAEPIKPELHRNLKVYHPSNGATRMQLPPDFYNVSAEEVKKEQQIRSEAVEKLGMLRTKEMRERDRLRELRRYRFTLIRVRFPDGVLLQGTFKAHEKFSSLLEFVRECLSQDWIPFTLATSTGQTIDSESATLAELELAPASIINFEYDKNILKEMAAEQGTISMTNHLKPELMGNILAL